MVSLFDERRGGPLDGVGERESAPCDASGERRGAGLCFARACALQCALVGVGAHLQPLGLLWRRFAVLLMLLSRALGGLGLGRLGMQCEQL